MQLVCPTGRAGCIPTNSLLLLRRVRFSPFSYVPKRWIARIKTWRLARYDLCGLLRCSAAEKFIARWINNGNKLFSHTMVTRWLQEDFKLQRAPNLSFAGARAVCSKCKSRRIFIALAHWERTGLPFLPLYVRYSQEYLSVMFEIQSRLFLNLKFFYF